MGYDPKKVEDLLGSLPLERPRVGLHVKTLRPAGVRAVPIVLVTVALAVGIWAIAGLWPRGKTSELASPASRLAEHPAAPSVTSDQPTLVMPSARAYITSPFTIEVKGPADRELFKWPFDSRYAFKRLPEEVQKQAAARISQLGVEDPELQRQLQHIAVELHDVVVLSIERHRDDHGPERLVAELPGEVREKVRFSLGPIEAQVVSLRPALDALPEEMAKLVETDIQQRLAAEDLGKRLDVLPPEVKSRVLVEIARLTGTMPKLNDKGVVKASRISVIDGQFKLEFRVEAGRKWLTASNHEGKNVYDGPVETSQERQKIPAEFRKVGEKVANQIAVDGASLILRSADEGAGRLEADQLEIRLDERNK